MAPDVAGRRVLVTGGAGFIGSHLVDALVPDNRVRVLDDCSTGDPDRLPDEVELIRGDVRRRSALERAMDGIDVVFHAAAIAGVPRSIDDPYGSHRINSSATVRLLELARDRDARVVVSSSAAIYGPPTDLPVRESAPKRPQSPYAVQKLAADHYGRIYADLYDLDAVLLRYFNVYGPGQPGTYAGVITTFLRQARRGDPLTVHGDGSQTRDFVHVDDVVAANLRAATTDHVGEAFNVGTGRGVSVADLASAVLDATGSDVGVVHRPPREGDVEHSRAAVSKARERLGFEATTSLREGLAALVDADPPTSPP